MNPKILVSLLMLSVSGQLIGSENQVVRTQQVDSKQYWTQQDQQQATQWRLNKSDWVKYKKIMAGPRGVWSPNIDPISALGVSETDPKERKRYANLWLEIESRRTQLELAFEVERQHVSKTFFKGIQPIAPQNSDRTPIQVTKRVMVFMDQNCTIECEAMFQDIASSLSASSRLDLYFQNGATAQDISAWASHMKIPPETVKARVVTLNYDKGMFAKMKVNKKNLPHVHIIEDGKG